MINLEQGENGCNERIGTQTIAFERETRPTAWVSSDQEVDQQEANKTHGVAMEQSSALHARGI